MRRVYLDNGSTSFPKAPGVSDAVKFFMDEVGANVNRGGYETAYSAQDVIMETRELLKESYRSQLELTKRLAKVKYSPKKKKDKTTDKNN